MFKKTFYLLLLGSYLYSNEVGIPNDTCALIIASRATKADVKAYVDENITNTQYVTLYQSNNGWYAIALGFLKDNEAKSIVQEWKNNGKIPKDSFCTHGNKFKKEVFLNTYDDYVNNKKIEKINYSSSKESKSSKCKNISSEKAVCYALSFGPKLCSEAITKDNPELGSTLGDRIALASVCTATVKESLASNYVPNDFLLTVILKTTEKPKITPQSQQNQ
jgi:hypothetical protein